MGEEAIEELPKTIVRRVVKEKFSQFSDAVDISLHKDALLAFSEGARVFIHYLSATANDLCKESKRQTMNAEDVLKAIEEIDFPEFLGPLRASLEDYRRKNSKKRAGAAKAKEQNKKRKEVVPPESGSLTKGAVEGGINDDDNADDQEQQNDADGEGNQDNNDDHTFQDSANSEGEVDDVDEPEQQNIIDEEEKNPEDAIKDQIEEQNDVNSDVNNGRSHETENKATPAKATF